MKQLVFLTLALGTVTLTSSTARAETPPSTGLGYTITGGILTGLGVATMAVSPAVCKPGISGPCYPLYLGLGGTLTLVGVPLLIIGIDKTLKYSEWRRNRRALEVVAGTAVTRLPGGGAVTWQTAF